MITEIAALKAPTASQPVAHKPAEAGLYLTFVLDTEVYALGILKIKEIIEYGSITEVPMMPAFVRGVINLRGSVVPVVDLAARFGRSATKIAKRTAIIIVETVNENIETAVERHREFGIIVDAVNEVVEITHQDINPAPTFGANIGTNFIVGMVKQYGKFIMLLNLDELLSFNEMAMLSGPEIEYLNFET